MSQRQLSFVPREPEPALPEAVRETSAATRSKAPVPPMSVQPSPQPSPEAPAPASSLDDLPLQESSLEMWRSKYQLKTKDGDPVDKDIEDMRMRVASTLAEVEKPKKRAHWRKQFKWALDNGALPAGRILSNVGSLEHKPATSTINCTVSATIDDSMNEILSKVHEAGMTLKAGCGIGYDFSTLRPRGSYVRGSGSHTSGPLSFMDIYDRMCFTISSAGGRRGAQMGVLDVRHPDVFDFIRAKREDGRLRQFNLSLLITADFISAVRADADWHLMFPLRRGEVAEDSADFSNPAKVCWGRWPGTADEGHFKRGGLTACKIYRTVRAADLWETIMQSSFEFSEPGFILIDRVNEMNNNWFCEDIRATNPCGEQPLPPYGACLLGSVNLTKFVENPLSPAAEFNWERYRKVVAVFSRMLDNVVEVSGLPLEEQRSELARKRRHGMGFLGLGSTLALIGIRYGSEESLEFTEKISRELAVTGWRQALELAKEKGPAPIMDEDFVITDSMLLKNPKLKADGQQAGAVLKGRELHARYSRYMNFLAESEPELVEQLAATGARYTHHSSIAPTGTISLSLGNNVSNGIEPSFSHSYVRNVIEPGRKSKRKTHVLSYESLVFRHLHGGRLDAVEDLPPSFVIADDITPIQHVQVQAAAQRWIDSSISKTVNFPVEASYEEFKQVYLLACEEGLKGCTTFRPNPEVFQGVLVKEDDLLKTIYEFTLEDGTKVCARGSDEIEYDGEKHSAANLFDALKEGYYGRF